MTLPSGHMSIGMLAARLAEADGANTPEFHARQLRGWVQNGILQPSSYRGEGRTAAAMFDDSALLKARICWALVRIGLTASQIEQATRCMNNWDEYPERIVAGCSTLVDLLKKQQQWFFQIAIWSNERMSGCFTKRPDFSNPLEAEMSYGYVVLDCQALWRGLVEIPADDAADPVSDGDDENDK